MAWGIWDAMAIPTEASQPEQALSKYLPIQPVVEDLSESTAVAHISVDRK
jgi:hypothetical protein